MTFSFCCILFYFLLLFINRKIDPATGQTFWVASIGMFAFSNSLALEDETICVTADNQGLLVLLCFNTSTGAGINSLSSFTDAGQLAHNASGMAIVNSTVYVSLPDLILIATPGSTRDQWTQTSLSIPGLNGLCRFNSSHLLFISGSSAELYEIAGGATTLFVDNLSNALVCNVNGDDGDVYVSNGLQIQKYDYSGKLLLTFGTEGGRYEILYLLNENY